LLATVNLGIYFETIGTALAPTDLADEYVSTVGERRMPSVHAAHWRRRLGVLMPAGDDVWWDAMKRDDVAALVRATIEVGVPELLRRTALPVTRDEWMLGGDDPRIGRAAQLLFAAMLSRELGDARDVDHCLSELTKLEFGHEVQRAARRIFE
jgi:hypothetical protein